MGKTWKRNAFVLAAGLTALVLVGDVEGQILGRRRRARGYAPIFGAPSYRDNAGYRSNGIYTQPSTADSGTYGGNWHPAPAYEPYGTYGGYAGSAGTVTSDAGVYVPSANSNAGSEFNGGGVVGGIAVPGAGFDGSSNGAVVGAGAAIDTLPPAGARPRDDGEFRSSGSQERLVPLQGERRDAPVDHRRNVDDAPPAPPGP